MSASGRAASTARSSIPAAATSAWRRSLGIADDVPVIGFVGRLVMEKGLDVFSDSDRPARPGARSATRCWSSAKGPARDWFEKRLPDAVFAGFQRGADLGRAVASMDMLFNPSVTETFGNVTLEAMAAGLPVVAAIATGSESLVTDGVTGRLIRAGRDRRLRRCARPLLHGRSSAPRGRRGRLRGEPALRLGRRSIRSWSMPICASSASTMTAAASSGARCPEELTSPVGGGGSAKRSRWAPRRCRRPSFQPFDLLRRLVEDRRRSCASSSSSVSSRVTRCQSAESRLPTARLIGAPPALRWSLPTSFSRSSRASTSSAHSPRDGPCPRRSPGRPCATPSPFASSIRPMSWSMVSVG